MLLLLLGCGDGGDPAIVMTFNTGTDPALGSEVEGDGYGPAEAKVSSAWYDDQLAWSAAVLDLHDFVLDTAPDVVAFQEIYWSGACGDVPSEFHPGFACEGYDGRTTVVETVLGPDYTIACHDGSPNRCLGVRTDYASLAGCDAGTLCLDGLEGEAIEGCGAGARAGRAEIELVEDGRLVTLVSVHASPGFGDDAIACRTEQVAQTFDLADGERTLVLGDFNTDPTRLTSDDASAAALVDAVRDRGFHWLSSVGGRAPGAYHGLDFDHLVSNFFHGSCSYPGFDPDTAGVTDIAYFDHVPMVCEVPGGW